MKSIVEEASSLEKAISSAWNRAGKPKKFTVTVFQESEKNFFGMTTLPAKIGFMFEEPSEAQSASQKRTVERPAEKTQKTSHLHQSTHTSSIAAAQQTKSNPQQKPIVRKLQPQQPVQPQKKVIEQKVDQEAEQKNGNRFWAPEMIEATNKWLHDSLNMLDMQSITFSIKPNRYHLKIQFSQPLNDDAKKEKTIFRSFAHLIMQAQRSQFKKAFKHHKVILIGH